MRISIVFVCFLFSESNDSPFRSSMHRWVSLLLHLPSMRPCKETVLDLIKRWELIIKAKRNKQIVAHPSPVAGTNSETRCHALLSFRRYPPAFHWLTLNRELYAITSVAATAEKKIFSVSLSETAKLRQCYFLQTIYNRIKHTSAMMTVESCYGLKIWLMVRFPIVLRTLYWHDLSQIITWIINPKYCFE